MNAYQIYDTINHTRLLEEYPIVYENSPSRAIKKYLKENGIAAKVKVSGDNFVHYGVFPIVIENGKVFRLGNKRQLRTFWNNGYIRFLLSYL